MGTLSRLHDFETDRDATPPVLISATKIDAELDQVITESNAQDVRLDAQEAPGNVSTADLADDAVDGDKIADNAVDSEHYTDGSIDLIHLSADSVDGTKLADNAVDSEHYTDGSIDLIHLSADSVDGTKIADNAIDSEHYTDGSIDNAHIADDAIDSEHYADGSIDNAHIADDAIDSEHYVDGSIDTAHLANDAVDGTKLADNAVDSEHYTDGSIDSVHLSADCVVSAKVENDSLMNVDINSSASIDATKIHDGSVTNTEFGYINTLSSNVQTQIDDIVAGTVEDVKDNVFTICDDLDSTKDIAFQASGITSGNTRTITMADQNIDLTPDTGTYQSAGSGVSAGFAIAMSVAL